MKICILEELDPDPIDAEFPYAPERYLQGHTWEKIALKKETVISQLKEIATKDFDVVLNLCDGAWGEDRPGIDVVQALERLNLAFTGADQYFYEPTRESMKMVCEVNHLGFPRGMQVTNETKMKEVLEHLHFPLLVKHPNSYASVALLPESKVMNEADLKKQTDRVIGLFGGALVEEFIEGTEYSVLVSENPEDSENPVVFAPVEVVFYGGESFKHEQLKWVDYHKISARPVTDLKLKTELEHMARKVFTGLHGTGYGRCDIRRDKAGNLYLLEINPNGAILYPPEDPGTADYILKNDPRGHKHFIDLLLQSAIKQREARDKGWKLKYSPVAGFGLYATKNFKTNDLVLDLENLPHRLSSTTQVKRLSREEKEKLYGSSFHITKNLFYVPAKYPEQWQPINHSCDPVLWFEKETLTLIARKPIKIGDRLSIDYGTIFSEEISSFDCYCGAKVCRKRISGADYLLDTMKKFVGHKSPYIETLAG
ncbi:SET domain-containing protein-lysine N-methyltransferase [bacterium]|nr:SET domain-containing protein-lysine N-methyltransferase [bacterium]